MKTILIAIILMAGNAFAQPTAKIGMISKTVATAGTPERVSATNLYARCIHFQAASTNTGLAYLGTSSASALAGAGMVLAKGSLTVPATDLAVCPHDWRGPRVNLYDFWANTAVNGEEVNVFYVE
jgi:hypothetical protein